MAPTNAGDGSGEPRETQLRCHGIGRTERCLKLGLGDEISSVKETKKYLQFPALDYENARARTGAPNPAFRLDFQGTCQSFEPTNGTRWPPDRTHQISQQSKQVIPRTDIPTHAPNSPAYRTRRATSRVVTNPGCSDSSRTPLVARSNLSQCAQLGRTLPRRAFGPALFGPALFAEPLPAASGAAACPAASPFPDGFGASEPGAFTEGVIVPPKPMPW